MSKYILTNFLFITSLVLFSSFSKADSIGVLSCTSSDNTFVEISSLGDAEEGSVELTAQIIDQWSGDSIYSNYIVTKNILSETVTEYKGKNFELLLDQKRNSKPGSNYGQLIAVLEGNRLLELEVSCEIY